MDFEKKLTIQLDFLKEDLTKFEKNPNTAVRIATLIRILVHDTSNSTSLLKHLGLKEDILFIDSCETMGEMPIDNFSNKKIGTSISKEDYIETNSFRGLTAENSTDNGVKLIPFFMHLEKGDFNNNEHILREFERLSFEQWWEAIIFKSSNGINVSRKYLTLNASNKDGGAHYDSQLPSKYISVQKDEILWPEGYVPENILNSPLYPSIFQIGWELLKSIELKNNV